MGLRLRAACVVFAVAAPPVLLAAGSAHAAVVAAVAIAPSPMAPGALRFANLTDDGAPIDLVLDGRLRVIAMRGGRTTDFMVVSAGTHTVGVRGTDLADALAITVASGASPTVLLLGDSSNPSVFTLPDVADSAPSVRVVNVSPLTVHVAVAADAFDIASGGSHLTPVKAASVEIQATVMDGGGEPSARRSVTVRPTASVTAVVSGTAARVAIHLVAPRALPPAALALQPDEGARPAVVRSMFRHDGMWVRRVLAAIVIVLVFAATLSSLAVFRVESLEDRVRNRMR